MTVRSTTVHAESPVRGITVRMILIAAASVALLAPGGAAQGDPSDTVEGRLLEILRENGVITAHQLDELTEMAKEIRKEKDLANRIDTQIDQMVASLQEEEAPTVQYRKGRGWRFRTGNKKFSLNIKGRIQVRFTHHFWEENPRTNDEEESEFRVRRARLRFQGNAFSKHVKYRVQIDLAGDEADTELLLPNGSTPDFDSDNRLSELKDAFVSYERWDFFKVRFGQFKVPYSRHFITSSARMQFVGRAITDDIFVPGRDIGLMVSGALGGKKDDLFEYYAGVFNGDGENRTNDDEGLMYAGRIAVNPFGEMKYRESDMRKDGEFRMAIGLNAWLHEDDDHSGLKDDWAVGADFAAAWNGFSALFEIHYRENGRRISHDVEVLGWMAQLGYMIVPETFEIALRAAEIDWDYNEQRDSGRREYLVVLGYFWDEHDLKVQLDFGRIEDHQSDHRDNKDEWRVRMQLQIVF